MPVKDLRQAKRYLILILGMCLLLIVWQRMSRPKLVVYCAHDSVFAEAILKDFERQTGIPVAVKYDTEATKSLGLVEQIIADGKRPRCDVFWNNELLGTVDLAERGLLEPHKGEGWNRIPAHYRDAEGRWAGFAARLRVLILNSTAGASKDAVADDQFPARSPGRFAMAKPLYGTTLTHYTVLAKLWGLGRLQAWHREMRAAGLHEANGNAGVKDLVAAGTADAGFTDTDDFFEARDAQKPVTALPATVAGGATITIPNTVAIIRGTRQLSDAQKLADFLLSARVEIALAKSKSRQIPIGNLDEKSRAQIPPEVQEWLPAASRGYPLHELLKLRNECLQWLKEEYLK